VVAQQDTSAVNVETICHGGYSMEFKLFPYLDNGATQVTFCTEVTPLSNEYRQLTAIKIEAEIRDPTKDPNDRESLMGSLTGDHRSIGCLSVNIFLRKVISHCRLFYSCRKCEHIELHVRCWEIFQSKSHLNADSGVDVNAA
jgi:hypothetical protein